MRKDIRVSLFLLVSLGFLAVSCARQYPQFSGRYHNKVKNNTSSSVSGNNNVEQIPQLTAINRSEAAKLTPIRVQPQAKEWSYTKHPKAFTAIQKVFGKKTGKEDIIAVKQASSATGAHPASGDDSTLIRGLIFIAVGLLLQGLWFPGGPFGFVLAVIGVVLIIYGVILVLRSI